MANPTMTKAELIARVAAESGASKVDTSKAVNALCVVIRQAVSEGISVQLPRVCKIKTVERAARQVRNPRTGETSMKEADIAVRVVVSKSLKDAAKS